MLLSGLEPHLSNSVELEQYSTDGDLSDDQVSRAADLIAEAGGRAGTVAEARSHLDAALAAVDGVGLEDPVVDELAELARFVADRDF